MIDIIPHIKTAIILILIGLLLASMTTIFILIAFPNYDSLTVAQIGLLIGELFLPIPIYIWARRINTDLKSFFRLNPVSLITILASLPLALGVTILTDELDRIAQLVLHLPNQFTKIQEVLTIRDLLSAIFIIGVVIIIAPFVEEIIFRGFFQRILEYRLKDVTRAVLYSALTFAIIHFNPWWAAQIYIIAVFMGYVAWRTNSIWIPFIIHAINNGTAVWFAHQSESGLQWYQWKGHVSPVVLLSGLILFILGIYWFIRVTPVQHKSETAVRIEELLNKPPQQLQ
jgi:membrane protease YdiL (CAAX protease family)